MDIMTKDDLKGLLEKRENPSVSIYMPTHRAGFEVRQNVIRYKNLVRKAERMMDDMGFKADEFFEPLRRLEKDGLFWANQGDGLALFASPGRFSSYRLSLSFDEVVVVADRFHVKPLLPLLTADGKFYVLAISQNDVRFLECNRQECKEIRPEKMPPDLQEALKYDDPQRQLQFHTGAQRAGSKRAAMFHGHGVGVDDAKDRILRYCQILDSALRPVLREERAPLILAGLDPAVSIYRQASGYMHITEEGIEGNPEKLNAGDLHRLGWDIAEPILAKARRDAAARYWDLTGTGLASCREDEILPSAVQGRIDFLFTAIDRHLWGTFNEETGDLTLHEENEPGDEDLLDTAAFWALVNGGAVYAVPQDEMPDASSLCAVFRY